MAKVEINWKLHPKNALEYALAREYGRSPSSQEVDRILEPLWDAFRVWVERYGWPGEVDSPTTLARKQLLAFTDLHPEMTQIQIAQKVGVSQSVVSRLLAGKSVRLQKKTVSKLLDALGNSPNSVGVLHQKTEK